MTPLIHVRAPRVAGATALSRDIVAAEGADLGIGESLMTECPFCLATEKKFAITRYHDGLGYICFRASCGERGSVGGTFEPLTRNIFVQVKSFEPDTFVGELASPQIDDFAGRSLARIGIACRDGETMYGIKSIYGGTGIYYPLWDYKGRTCGYQTRTERKSVFTGRLLEGQPYGMYASGGTGGVAWLVEDPLSAVRINNSNVNAITILGTNLPPGLDFLKIYERIYVALDPGAEEPARRIVRTLRQERGIDAVMVVLPDDIHRLAPETFDALMETYS